MYACYLNDTEQIMSCLSNGNKAQLNKVLQYYGTPLGICAQNDNLAAFQAIAGQGADLNKASLGERPLKIAFRYSPDIVRYIYENHREQFDKEVKSEGFLLACHTTDVGLLQLLKDCGCDMECKGKPFPPLHSFADYNNVVGIQFLADQGVNLHVLNNQKQTALDRAKSGRKQKAVQLLERLMN